MIPRAPVVADACVAVDDQRVDAKLLQACGNRETGLSAADNEHGGIAVGVGACFGEAIAPVLGAEVARRVRIRPALEFLFVTSELVQIRVQRPGAQAALRIGYKTQHAVAGPEGSLELEQGFNV